MPTLFRPRVSSSGNGDLRNHSWYNRISSFLIFVMKNGQKQTYCFGEIQVHLPQGAVTRQGETLHLRPRSFDVLVYLLENRDRVVTKKELIENVWKVTAITDDALVKSVVEIRKAIGDDSRKSRFLKTVPKIGYRFIGPVQETSAESTSVQIEKIRSIEFEVEEEVEEVKKLAPPDRKSGVRFMLALIFIAAAVSFYIGSRFFSGTDITVPVVPGKKTVAVAFFDNLSGDEQLDWLREGLAEMIITGLSQSDQLALLGRHQFYLLLNRIGHSETEKIRLNEALEIARRSKTQILVLGAFTKLGDQIRIDVQLYNTQRGQLIATDHLIVEKPEEILTNIDLLCLKISSRLGAAPSGPGSTAEITSVMTNHPDAYRYYSLALEKVHGLQNREAIDLLEKAIAIDPQFAMAHARIGYAYGVTWHLYDQAKPHLQKAFRLSERLTMKDRLHIAAWYAIANQDYSSAIASFRKIVNQYPLELEAYARLARLLQGEERYQEAINTLRQGLIIDPEAGEIHNGLGGLYSMLGRHKEAIRAHQKYVQLTPEAPNAYDSLGLSYQTAGLYQEAIQEYNRALALDPDFEIAVVHLGNTYFQLGQYRNAIREFQKYVRIAPSAGERTRGLDCIAYVYWKMGDLDLAEQTLGTEHHDPAIPTPLLIAADRADRIRAKAMETHFYRNKIFSDRGARLNSRLYYFPKGYVLLKSGKTAEAIEIFKEIVAVPAPTWNYDYYEDSLANAYLAAGRPDEAISEYHRILHQNPNYPLAHFHLAQAYEAKGRNDLARAQYEKFLEVWKDADRDLPQVKTAFKRLSL